MVIHWFLVKFLFIKIRWVDIGFSIYEFICVCIHDIDYIGIRVSATVENSVFGRYNSILYYYSTNT